MGKQYVSIETAELKRFVNKLSKAGNEQFRKDLLIFLEGIADEFLRIVEDEIIRTQTVDTRLLLNSFHKGERDNLYETREI